ncbi:hypothetical protein ACNI3K_02215 [Demequina sp. SO4-13]|uniref:hypothetical protein n=1 Tax=Demequina sp. SO4-13 TaxID=3401027 RepID=UPI003AF8B4B1
MTVPPGRVRGACALSRSAREHARRSDALIRSYSVASFSEERVRKVSKFIVVAAATLMVGLAGALAAALGSVQLGVLAGNLTLVLLAMMLVIIERRSAAVERRVRRNDAKFDALQRRVLGSLKASRVANKATLDMMQRRVVGALETARLEAEDRDRSARDER